MSPGGLQMQRSAFRAVAVLLLLAASPALGAAAAPVASAAAAAPAELRLDPVRLLTVGFTQAEIEEGESLGEDSAKFRVLATMKPFRITSGSRRSTDRAELEASFVPGPPVGLRDVFVNRPIRVDGRLRVFDAAGAASEWYFEPANFADWSPHVTYDRQKSRVTIIAPVALVDATRTHRVPILLVLNCRPAGDRLECERAGNVFAEDNAAKRALPDDPVDALGLHWEPRERREASESLTAEQPPSAIPAPGSTP